MKKSSLLGRLLHGSRVLVAAAALVGVIGGFGRVVLVALINQALSAGADELAPFVLSFAAAVALVLIARVVSGVLFARLAQSTKAHLSRYISHKIANARYQRLEREGPARAMATLTHDVDTLVVALVSVPLLLMQASVVLCCLVYLGWLAWPALALALGAILLGSLGFHVTNARARRHFRAAREHQDNLIHDYQGLFDGAKELRLNRARKEDFLASRIDQDIEQIRCNGARAHALFVLADAWGNGVFFAFFGATAFVLGHAFGAPAAVISGCTLVFLYLIQPINSLLSAVPQLQAAQIAIERIGKLDSELEVEASASPPLSSFATVALRGVMHRYSGEREDHIFTLGPLDLEFRPGEVVFLIGGNGSGKTTLAKLLVGLYSPERGDICVDGAPQDDASRSGYRQLFSTVFSDFHLFDGLLGAGADQDPRAQELLEALQLDHKLRLEVGRFSTTRLSQGQRKRLALLCAFLEDRPFYVFDEWAADQDPAFKAVFYEQLLPELKLRGKAVLVITHDDRYFDVADRCIRLEYGKIVDQLAPLVPRRPRAQLTLGPLSAPTES